jgi:hypothetical protein
MKVKARILTVEEEESLSKHQALKYLELLKNETVNYLKLDYQL